MKAVLLKVICVLLLVLLVLPSAASLVVADKTSEDSPGTGKKGKPDKPDKPSKNNAPIVTIVSPTETYVEGDTLTIVVTVTDEDENPVASIYVDLFPTFNTENTVTVDISDWKADSEHFITAAYTDSGDKTGGDDHLLIKI